MSYSFTWGSDASGPWATQRQLCDQRPASGVDFMSSFQLLPSSPVGSKLSRFFAVRRSDNASSVGDPTERPLDRAETPNHGLLEWEFDVRSPSVKSPSPPSAKPLVFISTGTGSRLGGGDNADHGRRQLAMMARARSHNSVLRSPSCTSLFQASPMPGTSPTTLADARSGCSSTLNHSLKPKMEPQFFDVFPMIAGSCDSQAEMHSSPHNRSANDCESDYRGWEDLEQEQQPLQPPSLQQQQRWGTMRTASQSWENPPRTMSLFSSENAESMRRLDTPRVISVVVIAEARHDQRAATVRPPPLAPLVDYDPIPELRPVGNNAVPCPKVNHEDEGFVADEVVKVSYLSGLAARGTLSLQVMQEHFLSGHNVMLFMGNTPRSTCLAEDMLSTIITSVYAASESMGSSILNEIAISAYGVIPEDGFVANLLPTNLGETAWQPMRLSANPIAGVVINNYQPVYMWAANQAQYLSRGLVHNARVMEADPYLNRNSVIWVTLLLKQARWSSFDVSEPGCSRSGTTSTTTGTARPYVYVSSMHIVFSGCNMPLIDEIIQHESLQVWPLFRHAFGGQCRTAVLAMVDDTEGPEQTQALFAVLTSRSQKENLPPHSGSVVQFLNTVSASLAQPGEPLDPSFLLMKEDANELLQDPCADIPFYDSDSKVDTRSYRRAHQVIMLEALLRQPKRGLRAPPPQQQQQQQQQQPSASQSEPRRERRRAESPPKELDTPKSVLVAAAAATATTTTATAIEVTPSTTNSSNRKDQSGGGLSPVTDSSGETIRIAMPSSVRAREVAAHIVETLRQDTAEGERWPAENGDRKTPTPTPTPTPVSSRSATRAEPPAAEVGLRNSSRLKVRNSRTKGIVLIDVAANAANAAPRRGGETNGTRAPRAEGSEAVVSRLDDTHVMVLASRSQAASNGDLSNGPSLNSSESGDSEKAVRCRFRADATREVRLPPASGEPLAPGQDAQDNNRDLQLTALLSMPQLSEIGSAFVREQRNAAILSTTCTDKVRPFVEQPLWGAVRIMLNEAMLRHRALSKGGNPTTLTLFGSLLSGREVLRDLASPDNPQHTANAEWCTSPLFGALLFQTRSVDLRCEDDSGEVLTTMLEHADEAAGDDTAPYVVLTCVQMTTYKLKEEEMTDVDREYGYHYDATFSSLTVVCTRNSTEFFKDCLHRDASRYPISLINDAVHGAAQTLCVLHTDATAVDRTKLIDALLVQNRMLNVKKPPPRSGRVRAYIEECLMGMSRIEEKEKNPKLTEEERNRLLGVFDVLDAMAREHEVYLTDCCQEGYVLYPGTSDSPNIMDPNAVRDATSPQSTTATATTSKDGVAPPVASMPPPPPSSHDADGQRPTTAPDHRGPTEDVVAASAGDSVAPSPTTQSEACPTHDAAAPLDEADDAAGNTNGCAVNPEDDVHCAPRDLSGFEAPESVEQPDSPPSASRITQPMAQEGSETQEELALCRVTAGNDSAEARQERIANGMRPLSTPHKSNSPVGTAKEVAGVDDVPLAATGPPPSGNARPHSSKSGSSRSGSGSSDSGSSGGGSGDSGSSGGDTSFGNDRMPSEDTQAPKHEEEDTGCTREGEEEETVTQEQPSETGAPESNEDFMDDMQLSARPLSKTSGMVVSSVVLLAHLPGGASTEAEALSRGLLFLHSRRRSELLMHTKELRHRFQLDELIEVSVGTAYNGCALNTKSLSKSRVLMQSVSGYLRGSNASLVLQATLSAEALRAADSFVAQLFFFCLAHTPSEVEFFMSIALVPPNAASMVDLLHANPDVVDAEEEQPLRLGFSPFIGPFVRSAKLMPVLSMANAMQYLLVAMKADRLRTPTYGGHLVVISLMQKTVIEAEQDVSASSLLIIMGRGDPNILQTASSTKSVSLLMNYALGGPCLSVCTTIVTDEEPESSGADVALTHQQDTLCGVTGKPITYNSYSELLQHHLERLAAYKAQYSALRVELESGRPLSDEEKARVEEKRDLVKSAIDRTALMLEDERRVLESGGLRGLPPPFYPL